MDLLHIAEASPDEHLVLYRMPVEERGRSRLAVARGLFGNGNWDGRDVLKHQVVAGLDQRVLNGGRLGETGKAKNAKKKGRDEAFAHKSPSRIGGRRENG
jgi:hypothetical protein